MTFSIINQPFWGPPILGTPHIASFLVDQMYIIVYLNII